jgi:predicted peptidase
MEFPARAVTFNGVEYSYRVFVPKDVAAGERLPVMLYLHGSNRRGTDNRSQVLDLYENIRGFPQNFRFIIVFPQCREDKFWAGPMLGQAMAALDQTIKEFNADPFRVYLAGYSMGGFGTWQMAIEYPAKFTALVPVAGGVEPLGEISEADKKLLSQKVKAAAASPDVYRAYADALNDVPVWIVHGADDTSVPVEQSRKMVEALRAAGNIDVNYVELEGVGHGSIVQAFSDPRLFEWLAVQKRVFKDTIRPR